MNIVDTLIAIAIPVVIVVSAVVFKSISDDSDAKRARERVLEAEKAAFKSAPEAYAQRTDELRDSRDSVAQQSSELRKLVHSSQAALQVGNLFDLYSKQIEKYQTETQARAGWSFIFAIVSMFAGLGFVVLGGAHILTNPGWEHVAAATGISGIGGAVGAFITKTFLDVHRLSLSQLNHYFRQPVLNAHVLTAQRIAEQIPDPLSRQKAYQQILTNVVALVRDDQTGPTVWVQPDGLPAKSPALHKPKPRAQVTIGTAKDQGA